MNKPPLAAQESIECWCATCKQTTPHRLVRSELTHGAMRFEYACAFEHKPKSPAPPKQMNVGAVPSKQTQAAIDLARHMQALDGPTCPHDSSGNLPPKRSNRK
jgi:hypothetical protein